MRPVGFSTGALALGDVERALRMLEGSGATAVELSALRLHELAPLLERLASLDLGAYDRVSLHAPSRFSREEEPRVLEALAPVVARGIAVILHPDTLFDVAAWRSLGPLACVENMDLAKPLGRTLAELEPFFAALPDATFCLDVGHARQVDSTMERGGELARALAERTRQLHVSEVDPSGGHHRLSPGSIADFRALRRWVPERAALILETPASLDELKRQMDECQAALAR